MELFSINCTTDIHIGIGMNALKTCYLGGMAVYNRNMTSHTFSNMCLGFPEVSQKKKSKRT